MNPQTLHRCPKGHYYTGDHCPYCPTQYYPVSGDTKASPTYNPNTIPTDTTVIATHSDIPLCPHCGKPVRKHVPMPPKDARISSIQNMGDGIVPWNFGWDGRCENCGHDYNVVMRIDMGSRGPDNRDRQTVVKVGARGYCHNVEAFLGEGSSTVLSGVEIETRCGHQVETLFLSANELKYLMKALQNSPILKQLDYYDECMGGDLNTRETL
ncbi:MAG: hypothetical protein J6Z26_04980 [Bacteroidales bacterium]|nr:hypothetical protein [Bacteroidales bacterium]